MLGWLRATLGPTRALELARAGDGILPAVRALGEDVWLREAGMIEIATTDEQESALAEAPTTARELGVPDEARALSAEEVQRRCASPRFRSGVLFRECATVQPARLARALRRTALAAGVGTTIGVGAAAHTAEVSSRCPIGGRSVSTVTR